MTMTTLPAPNETGTSPQSQDRILIVGRPNFQRCDNTVITSRYTLMTFLPVATWEQFRRCANQYFLVVGCVMAIGYYVPKLFESAFSPWSEMGPLILILAISLVLQGRADRKRHRNDYETNYVATCVVLSSSRHNDNNVESYAQPPQQHSLFAFSSFCSCFTKKKKNRTVQRNDIIGEIDPCILQGQEVTVPMNGHDSTTTVHVALHRIRQKDLRQGHLVLVRNGNTVPADVVLLASSNHGNSAYVETSSIDGETNLKLKTSPLTLSSTSSGDEEEYKDSAEPRIDDYGTQQEEQPQYLQDECLKQAIRQITRITALGCPHGISALEHPNYHGSNAEVDDRDQQEQHTDHRWYSLRPKVKSIGHFFGITTTSTDPNDPLDVDRAHPGTTTNIYVATLKTEAPNTHINTFTGKLTLPPPVGADGTATAACIDLALGAENMLLRGAVLRNTEWVIGVACFTGRDTKLVQNSIQRPPFKFSRLEKLMNRTVLIIIGVMVLCVAYLATLSVIHDRREFSHLWYLGYNKNVDQPWPYLPHLSPPAWETSTRNWVQLFLYYITLLNNFVPLSLIFTVDLITFFMLAFINLDLDIYDPATDTRAVARSTIVTDLGQVEYIFCDKTGTLTQNVMHLQRCSVDGSVFGEPMEPRRPRPGATPGDAAIDQRSPVHPLHQLLGRGNLEANPPIFSTLPASPDTPPGLEVEFSTYSNDRLSFNAEMFLRVMCLCHTVVVDKVLDENMTTSTTDSRNVVSPSASWSSRLFGLRSTEDGRTSSLTNVMAVAEEGNNDLPSHMSNQSATGIRAGSTIPAEKGKNGAPTGYAYHGESPDECALVSAASTTFGFQVIAREHSEIKLRCSSPTHFLDARVVRGLKYGTLTPKAVAATTALKAEILPNTHVELADTIEGNYRDETWQILAVNKFDPDRKRMSLLLRSPVEMGGIPILLCKGADSAMLDSNVSSSGFALRTDDFPYTSAARQSKSELQPEPPGGGSALNSEGQREGESAKALPDIQAHLDKFASEGLRTLVLGMRVVTEQECSKWLKRFHEAATSIDNRHIELQDAAVMIERDLHIVGVTAIEDKLQDGVPEAVANLGKAGIKLWVLAGDKRETATEIGYSTHFLTPQMHLTEIPDTGENYVRARMAIEFIRLVKMGKLPLYQRAAIGKADKVFGWENFWFKFGKFSRAVLRVFRRLLAKLSGYVCLRGPVCIESHLQQIDDEVLAEERIVKSTERRRRVRHRADKIIRDFLNSPEGLQQQARSNSSTPMPDTDEEDVSKLSRISDTVPAGSCRARSPSKQFSQESLEELSLNSVQEKSTTAFDEKQRTVLERMFAVDEQVRKGRLLKHACKSKLASAEAEAFDGEQITNNNQGRDHAVRNHGQRALVIEGDALKHLQGDPELEEIFLSVASNCDAVIACRVSPKQKALLVRLVHHHVVPRPITLAIGDGANDVGMIQEAHVGVGISGKEGKEAVNSSDFAIAQFRFLETLLLIHGRWNCFRMSTVILFFFYKNVVTELCLIAYTAQALYSGTPLFDQWILSMLNFVAAVPILFLGLFDRCLDKSYIRKHPEVYRPTRTNELITGRTQLRWIVFMFVHALSIYYMTVPTLAREGGGTTSAWQGLMRNKGRDTPGDGEGGDLLSVGTVSFTCLILLLAYKVLYESRSIILGVWPWFTCRSGGERCSSRLPYTWLGVVVGSIGLYLIFISAYQTSGRTRMFRPGLG